MPAMAKDNIYSSVRAFIISPQEKDAHLRRIESLKGMAQDKSGYKRLIPGKNPANKNDKIDYIPCKISENLIYLLGVDKNSNILYRLIFDKTKNYDN